MKNDAKKLRLKNSRQENVWISRKQYGRIILRNEVIRWVKETTQVSMALL